MHALEADAITPARYRLLAATGDEVLDYRHVAERSRGARQIVNRGSNHGFSDIANYLDTVFAVVGV